MVTDTASCPVDWRLFVPESWDPASPKAAADVHVRRRKAGMSEEVVHREKWRLALDMVDELMSWGRRPPLIVADCGYGDNAEFRHELAERGTGHIAASPTPDRCAHSPPPPITERAVIAHLHIHRYDRLGGLLHEYQHVA